MYRDSAFPPLSPAADLLCLAAAAGSRQEGDAAAGALIVSSSISGCWQTALYSQQLREANISDELGRIM